MDQDQQTLLQCSRFHVAQLRQTLEDGRVRMREVVRHPGAVVILPFVDANHVCLIRNYRIAVAQTLIELPAGTRELDEPPEQTAVRELLEETGYRADRVEQIATFYPSPGILDEKMLLYIARDLRKETPQREIGEQIDNLITPFDKAIKWSVDGTIQDAKTICGLLLWQAKRASGVE